MAFHDAIQNCAGFVASSEVGFGSLKVMNDVKKHEASVNKRETTRQWISSMNISNAQGAIQKSSSPSKLFPECRDRSNTGPTIQYLALKCSPNHHHPINASSYKHSVKCRCKHTNINLLCKLNAQEII